MLGDNEVSTSISTGGISNAMDRFPTKHLASRPVSAINSYQGISEGACPVASRASQLVLRRGLKEKDVRVALFLLEGAPGFEHWSLRSQMTAVAERGDMYLQAWFVEEGGHGRLGSSWEEFKEKIVGYCTQQDLRSKHRYQDESWADFALRLLHCAPAAGWSEEEILDHLYTEAQGREPWSAAQWPSARALAAHLNRPEMKRAAQRAAAPHPLPAGLVDKPKVKPLSKTDPAASSKPPLLKCRTCHKSDHRAEACPNRQVKQAPKALDFQASADKHSVVLDLPAKTDEAGLNGQRCVAWFGTGASCSIITRSLLERLGVKEAEYTRLPHPRVFVVAGGMQLRTIWEVVLTVKYRKRVVRARFAVISAGLKYPILGHSVVCAL